MNRIAGLFLAVGLLALVLHASPLESLRAGAEPALGFGFLLLAAYLAGDILSWSGLPRITGYILSGIVFGPHVLDLVSATTVADLKLIDDLALTFIALAAGGELRLAELRCRRRSILLTVLFQGIVVFVGVGVVALAARPLLPFLAGKPFVHLLVVAALLGAFAMARSPSSAIAIISESKARGPFTETVLGVTVIMDVLVIIVFAIVVSVGQSVIVPGESLDVVFLLLVGVEITASVLAGLVLASVISLYIRLVRADLSLFILAVAFSVTFGARQFAHFLDAVHDVRFHLEPMLVCLTAGFCVRNFTLGGDLLMEKIDRSSLPIYVIFFALTGAALDIGVLENTWVIAPVIVCARAGLIWIGAYLGARASGDPPAFRRYGGAAHITQAGVSLGLAGIVMVRFPEWGEELATTIVAVIAINQVIGPVALRFSLGAVGEVGAARRVVAGKEHSLGGGGSEEPEDR